MLFQAVYDASPDGELAHSWDRLDEAHRALFVVWGATAETSNGSLHQYFANSTADLAAALPEAARFFAADDLAEILDRALAFFDNERVADRAYRNDRLDELDASGELQAFDALTDEIFALEEDQADIYAAITRYVEEHPATFFV
jgi:hypothetical protein